jgi:hypothetical protein
MMQCGPSVRGARLDADHPESFLHADSHSAAQAQGVSSSMREAGQRLTSFVRTE